jgi:hypothetical protein
MNWEVDVARSVYVASWNLEVRVGERYKRESHFHFFLFLCTPFSPLELCVEKKSGIRL